MPLDGDLSSSRQRTFPILAYWMNDPTIEAVRQYLPPEVGDCASC
jgi:hypothetical protein